jgi:hypothetical protein
MFLMEYWQCLSAEQIENNGVIVTLNMTQLEWINKKCCTLSGSHFNIYHAEVLVSFQYIKILLQSLPDHRHLNTTLGFILSC